MTPWVKKIKGPHECVFPINDELESFLPGSVWKCEECKQVWMFKPYLFDAHRWVKI